MVAGKVQGKVRRWILLTILFVAALALRWFRAEQETIANPDVMRFVDQAKGLAHDSVATMRTEVYHPLHAAAALLVHGVLQHWISNERWAWLWSLRVVGTVAGSVVAVQIVLLSRYFGAPFWASYGAGMVWMVGRRTSVYGADGLSDMLTLALFAGAILVALPAMRFVYSHSAPNPLLRLGQAARFLVAGILSGLAYLTRPEGLAAALIVGLTLGVMAVCRQRGRQRAGAAGRRFKVLPRTRIPLPMATAAMVCLLAGFLIPALPYMLTIGGLTGKKSLTMRGEPGADAEAPALAGFMPVLGAGGPGEPEMKPWPLVPGPVQKVTIELLETFFWAPWLVLLLAVPLMPRLWGRPRVRPLVLVWIVVWDGVMYWLLAHAGYLDGRHTLAVQLVLHGLFALALVAWTRPMRWWMQWWQWDMERWERLPAWRRWKLWPRAFALGVCGLAMVPGIVELARPPRIDKLNLREAAAFVQNHMESDVVVCDYQRLVGFYSMRPYAQWHGSAADPQFGEIEAIRRAHPGAAIVLGKTYVIGKEEPAAAIGPYHEVKRFESRLTTQREVYVLYALPAAATGISGAPAATGPAGEAKP